jgi:hypothetical protein
LHAINEMVELHAFRIFFPKGGEGVWAYKFSNFFVPMSVPMMYPKGVPNNTTLLSHVVCPKSSPSHLLRWAKEKALHLYTSYILWAHYDHHTHTWIFEKKKCKKCELVFEIFNLKMQDLQGMWRCSIDELEPQIIIHSMTIKFNWLITHQLNTLHNMIRKITWCQSWRHFMGRLWICNVNYIIFMIVMITPTCISHYAFMSP